MKKVLIIAGTAVVGVGLAAVLVPWGRLATPPIPDAPAPPPPPAAQQARKAEEPSFTRDRAADAQRPVEPREVQTNQPSTQEPGQSGNEDRPQISSARQAANERLQQPDIKLATNANLAWQATMNRIATQPKDPGAEFALDRARELRGKLQEYARDPSSHDLNELMAEQEHIMGQLRQTSHWDSEMEQMEGNLNGQWDKYRETTNTAHPYR